MKCARIAVGCLALALAASLGAGGAAAQDEDASSGGGFTQLDDLHGKTVRMDDLKKDPPASLDESLSGESSALGNVDNGGSSSIDQTREKNRGWQPPPCEGAPQAGGGTPPANNLAGWEKDLSKAEQDLAESQARWKKLETGAARVRVKKPSRQAAANRGARDQARDAYAKARCDLVDLIDQARRAGVPPGALRPHIERLPADLKP